MYNIKYPTDLTESQLAIVLPLLPKPKSQPGKQGRPPRDLQTVVNGIFYVNKTGCQWRMLPKTFGPWSTIYGYFNRWSKACIWQNIMDVLRKKDRKRKGRKTDPSAGCIDSQSVKASTQGTAIGFDGYKRIKGRKRHILTDTLGIILAVVVTAANMADKNGLVKLLQIFFRNGVRRLRKIWVDGAYMGLDLQKWVEGLKKTHKIHLEVVEKEGKGFHLVKRRWVVERTFSWLFNFRRHSKDYEILTRNSDAMIQISMIQILIKRLA